MSPQVFSDRDLCAVYLCVLCTCVCVCVSPQVFSDRDLSTARAKERVEAALKNADVFFASLLFDYDSVSESL